MFVVYALCPDYCNVYNLSQRHLYRYSNETYQKAMSNKNPVYAFSAIALYGWTIMHSVLFWVCYHWGFKQESNPVLSWVYLAEYTLLYCIYGMIIFNVLHCDRILDIIQNTSWFDGRLGDIIKSSLLGDQWKSEWGDVGDERMNKAVMTRLNAFYVHHQRMVQITVQHYMMLHILNLVLKRPWLSELIIEYLFGFHAFCDGDGNINALIKNIIHGRDPEMERPRHREWSPSESRSRSHVIQEPNLDDVPIPTDSNLMGISQRIINTPNIEQENGATSYDGGNLLNDFMEEKYVENRRTSADGMCLCHEDDRGFIGMWDALNLDAIRMQYDALKCERGRQSAIQHQHAKTIRSLQFYFVESPFSLSLSMIVVMIVVLTFILCAIQDFLRSLHHQRFGTVSSE